MEQGFISFAFIIKGNCFYLLIVWNLFNFMILVVRSNNRRT